VRVPEWGGEVNVRELTGNERDQYDAIAYDRRGDFRGLRAALVAIALCDENGESLGFTEAEVEQLGNKSGSAIDRCFEVVKDLSGMNEDGIEEAEKN
jgi:hypothetical protein